MPSSTASVVSSEISWTRSGGKLLRGVRHRLLDLLPRPRGRSSRGAGRPRSTAAGRAVVPADLVVQERPELDPGNVAQPDLRSVRIRPENDLAELLFGEQAALRPDRVREIRSRRGGRAADLSGGGDDVLILHRVDDIRDGESRAWRAGRA